MPELVLGLADTLFERLSQRPSASPQFAFLATEESVQTSIARELARLFNTRRPQGCGLDVGLPPTVLDYGLPDFISRHVIDLDTRNKLAREMTQAIEWFEPRLRDPEVCVLAPHGPGAALVVQVRGSAAVGDDMRRIEFDLDL